MSSEYLLCLYVLLDSDKPISLKNRQQPLQKIKFDCQVIQLSCNSQLTFKINVFLSQKAPNKCTDCALPSYTKHVHNGCEVYLTSRLPWE